MTFLISAMFIILHRPKVDVARLLLVANSGRKNTKMELIKSAFSNFYYQFHLISIELPRRLVICVNYALNVPSDIWCYVLTDNGIW